MDMDMDDGGGPGSPPPPQRTPGQAQRRQSMNEDEQKERRASIQAIMKSTTLTPTERRKSIQALMDGRRRSSTASANGGGMAAAAAAAAAAFDDDDSDFDSDDDDDDDVMASSSRESSLTSGVSSGTPGGGGGGGGGGGAAVLASTGSSGRRNRSSLRGSFTAGFAGMSTGAGDGIARRDSTQSSSSSIDPGSGHHLGSAIGSSRKMEKKRPECNHYDRKCTIVSPCCGLAFGCRICHDDSPVLPPPIFSEGAEGGGQIDPLAFGGAAAAAAAASSLATDGHDSEGGGLGLQKGGARKKMARSSSMPSNFSEEETHHDIDRFLIKEVICRDCYTRQSSKTNNCIKCNVEFGSYHCSTCNLWMSADEEPYHCADCGFCRVGGRENFKHCHDCGMCIDSLLFDDHNCKTGKYMSNCPVCQEDLFSSRSASHEMPCGHAIHWHCFRELTSFDTRCPVCKKTAETHEQMAPTWQAMAMGIALQPVPPDLARVVTIICNDCEEKDEDRRWHFLGVQCVQCTSFNTTVETTQLVGHEAAAFLGDVDATPPDGAHSAFSGRPEPPAAAHFDSSMSNGMDAAGGGAGAGGAAGAPPGAGGGGVQGGAAMAAAALGAVPPGAFLGGGGADQAMHGGGMHDMVMDDGGNNGNLPGPGRGGGTSPGQPRR